MNDFQVVFCLLRQSDYVGAGRRPTFIEPRGLWAATPKLVQ